MNILLLSNGAPNYHHFFNELAKRFAEDGAEITIAVDSQFSRRENRLEETGFVISEFSSYFVKHHTDANILKRYAEYDLNSALLSDFERAQVYSVWGNNVNVEYYDKLKSALLSFFEEIFEHRNINTVLYENVSNTFAHYALFVAQNKGAVYCGVGGSRLPGRFSITSDPLNDDAVVKALKLIQTGGIVVDPEIRNWAADYIRNIEKIIPDYMKINGLDQIGLLKKYLRRDRLGQIVSLLKHSFDNRTDAFQVGNPLLSYTNLFVRNVKRRLKIERLKKMYMRSVVGEKFLLYPMHFHPESSTSILAGTYLDEYEVIRNIAFSLPEGHRLYVKDHVSAWGYPSLEFYNKIKRLPNVRLLGPNENTKQLIKESCGVITLTSTVGYEALLLKKRVYLFGRVFYEFHKGVKRIENPGDLRRLIQKSIREPIDWDEEYSNDFVCAYYYSTLPGSCNLMQKGAPAIQTARCLYEVIKLSVCVPTAVS